VIGIALAIPELHGPTFLIQGVPAALIVGALVLGPQLRDTRATALLARIGDASYSLYLSHTFVLRPLRNLWAVVVGDRLPASVFVIAAIATAVVVSLLLYHAVERPLTSYLQRRLLARPARVERDAATIAAASRPLFESAK
jgi:exopolysaccharide production protein ExoZ